MSSSYGADARRPPGPEEMTHNGSLRTIEWAIPIIFLSVILPFSGAAQKEEPESIVPADATNRLCQSVRVCGVVAEVNSALQDFNSSAPAFLNLERPYPEQPLTLIILAADRSKFDELDAYK